MDKPKYELTLHGYYRSSCSARVRLALYLKQIPFTPIYVDIKNSHHLQSQYSNLNPSSSVPTLQVKEVLATRQFNITQSIAAIEFVEEAYPDRVALLPTSPEDVAFVRTLVNILACDVQPTTNMKILKRVTATGGDANQWARELMTEGISAYEATLDSRRFDRGRYSFSDQLTSADVCLAPAVWNAQRYGVDLSAFPNVMRVFDQLMQLEAFQRGHWQAQEDCPLELRSDEVKG